LSGNDATTTHQRLSAKHARPLPDRGCPEQGVLNVLGFGEFAELLSRVMMIMRDSDKCLSRAVIAHHNARFDF
jgi:hypothetical protein